MVELAKEYRYQAPRAADSRKARWTRFVLQPAAVGLLLALGMVAGLGGWFEGQATREATATRADRIAAVEATGLAAAAARQLATAPEDTATLQALLVQWSAAPGERRARILRIAGAQLLASTVPADLAGELPRRLTRDEKWLFDLGQELRAATDTNRAEGVMRKAERRIERPDPRRVVVALPLELDGRVVGLLHVEAPAAVPPALPRGGYGWITPALLAVLLLLAFLLERAGVVAREPVSRRGWLLGLVALALLILGAGVLGRHWTTAVEAALTEADAAVAATQRALPARLGGLTPRTGWDTDQFRRPTGIVAADGSLVEAAERRAHAAARAPFVRALAMNALVAAGVLLFFALGGARRLWRTLVRHREAYLYTAPAMLGMLVLVFFPFAYGITLSFTGQTIFNVSQPLTELWVGFTNYVDILGNVDVATRTATGWAINYQNFYWTLFITVCWTASNVAVGVTLGMILALALNTPGLRGRAIYRVLLILPWAIPNYITALIWKALFHQQFGAVNQAIQLFGGEPVAWFDSVFSSFMTGLVTNGWLSFPFMMVVILGGLQSISADMYEAATVEGATPRQQFWRITLPLLKPTLVPAVILSVVWTFNMFNVIYLVSGGEPAGANEILITKAYKIAFEEYRYAYSAAYSTVIFLILLVYGAFQARVTRATEAVHT